MRNISPELLDISNLDSGAKWFKYELEYLLNYSSFEFYRTVYFWLYYIEKLNLIDKFNDLDPVKFIFTILAIKYNDTSSVLEDINQIGNKLNYEFDNSDKIKENFITFYSSPVLLANAINIIIPKLTLIHEVMISRGFDWDHPYLGINFVGYGLLDESIESINELGEKITKRRSELLAIKLHNMRVRARESFVLAPINLVLEPDSSQDSHVNTDIKTIEPQQRLRKKPGPKPKKVYKTNKKTKYSYKYNTVDKQVIAGI